MLGFPLNGDIGGGINSVGTQDVIQRILRRGTLAAGIDGLTSQVFHALDSIPALYDVENAQSIDG